LGRFSWFNNIADIQATAGVSHLSAYIAAKAALISITKSMAVELAPHVRVNAVLPGSFTWPETEAKAPIEAAIPLGDIGRWSDIVQTVSYLESARYMTGACVPVDGGRLAKFA
jgi:pteridine reductase